MGSGQDRNCSAFDEETQGLSGATGFGFSFSPTRSILIESSLEWIRELRLSLSLITLAFEAVLGSFIS